MLKQTRIRPTIKYPYLLRRKPRIFISYRREDSSGYAGRVCADLRKYFGVKRVTMDISTFRYGENFVDAIEREITYCNILISVIGRQWLTITENTLRRIDDPKDFVHREIAVALNHHTKIIPVLVQGAVMPSQKDLPDPLQSISHLNALRISDERWDFDLKLLITSIQDEVSAPSWLRVAMAVFLIAAMAITIALLTTRYKTLNEQSVTNKNEQDLPSTNTNGNANVSGQQNQTAKTVVIMDNNLLVYDERSKKLARTNIDDIRDALKDLGLNFIPQPTNLEWNEFAQVSSSKPDLIIVHASCFYKKTNVKDSERKFFAFLESVSNSLPKTKLLIYSRAFEKISPTEIYERMSPDLKERTELLLVKGRRNASFRNMSTIGDLQTRVKKMLELKPS